MEICRQTHSDPHQQRLHSDLSILKTMEWTRDKIINCIENYRERTLLWDPTHVHYKHRFKRADAWRELAGIFEVPRDEVEKKMKNLISQFRRVEKKKTKEKKIGQCS